RDVALERVELALHLADLERPVPAGDQSSDEDHRHHGEDQATVHRAGRVYSARPGHDAAWPSSSSILSSWLYFAVRSPRASDPVLIWPAFTATARSATNVSSVSPERCEMTVPEPARSA